MPSNTLSCQIVVSVNEYTVRQSIVTLGNASDVKCYLPSNKSCQFNIINVNLLGILSTERLCITHSYGYHNLSCICPAPSIEKSNAINCIVNVFAESYFNVCEVQVRVLGIRDITCTVPIYEYEQRNCITTGKNEYDNSIICYLPIASESYFNVIDVDVEYLTSDEINCQIYGELYDDILCSIVTNTKIDTINCLLHNISDIDVVSDVNCVIYRQAGEPVDYVCIEVVLGEREIDTVNCIAEIPENLYSDINCSTSYVVSGEPRWNRFSTSDSLIVRVINIGDIQISKAVLQSTNDTIYEAKDIEQLNSVWQVKFDKYDNLYNYVIVLSLSNGKVVVVDKSKSYFSLG